MFAEERKQQIIEIINQKKKATVKELSLLFNASPGTIRNDLTELERLDLLSRTHGGAISNNKASFERKYVDKGINFPTEKYSIARHALNYIEDYDSIALDTGSTTLELAKLLNDKHYLTVVTNDLMIAMVLEDHPDATVMLVGGKVRKDFHCTIGPTASNMLAGIRVDKTFVGANGISPVMGLSTPDVDTAQIKSDLIKIAEEVILLCDSSKFSRASFMRFAELSELDLMITDSGAPRDKLNQLADTGLKIEVVDKNSDLILI